MTEKEKYGIMQQNKTSLVHQHWSGMRRWYMCTRVDSDLDYKPPPDEKNSQNPLERRNN